MGQPRWIRAAAPIPVTISGKVSSSGSQKCSASITAISSNCQPSRAVAAIMIPPPPFTAAQAPISPAASSING